jgi:Glycosyl hydrolases family 38 C-terminal domain.
VKSGVISKVSNKYSSLEVKSEWGYYKSWAKYPDKVASFFGEPASGAYIFRPDIPNARYHKLDPVVSDVYVYEGDIATEVHTTFEGSWIHQIIKIYKEKDYVDIDFTVGPIPVDDGVGKEVVHRIRTNIRNNGIFYTDSNGREFIKRERSKRQTWSLREFEPVAGNYYPVNTAMYIEDNDVSASILTDRSKGGSSLIDGSMELMVHRRIIIDDSRGVGEALNETDSISPYPPFGNASRLGKGLIVSGTHRLYIGKKKAGAKMARKEMDAVFSPLIVFAGKRSQYLTEWKSIYEPIYIAEMPSNIQLLTLKLIESMCDNTKYILLRLGHAYGKDECKTNSGAIEIDLAELFPSYELLGVTEMTLTGNRNKDKWERMKVKWMISEDGDKKNNTHRPTVFHIGPMEIKTFRIMLRTR